MAVPAKRLARSAALTESRIRRLMGFPFIRKAISSALERVRPENIEIPKAGRFVSFRVENPRAFHPALFATISVGGRGTLITIGTPKAQIRDRKRLDVFLRRMGWTGSRWKRPLSHGERRSLLYQLRAAGVIGGSRTQRVLVPRSRVADVARQYVSRPEIRKAVGLNPLTVHEAGVVMDRAYQYTRKLKGTLGSMAPYYAGRAEEATRIVEEYGPQGTKVRKVQYNPVRSRIARSHLDLSRADRERMTELTSQRNKLAQLMQQPMTERSFNSLLREMDKLNREYNRIKFQTAVENRRRPVRKGARQNAILATLGFNPLNREESAATLRGSRQLIERAKKSKSERHRAWLAGMAAGQADIVGARGPHAAAGVAIKVSDRAEALRNPKSRRNTNGEGGYTVSGSEQIAAYRMMTLRRGLKLELVGIKMSRGPSAFSIIKREFGLKGNKQAVYDQFSKMVDAIIEHRAKPPGFNPRRSRRNADPYPMTNPRRQPGGGWKIWDAYPTRAMAAKYAAGAMSPKGSPEAYPIDARVRDAGTHVGRLRYEVWIRRRKGGVPSNPLTRKEAATVLRRALGQTQSAEKYKRDWRGKYYGGRADGMTGVVHMYGPEQASRVARKIDMRTEKALGLHPAKRNNPSTATINIPFREGQKITPAQMRQWLGSLPSGSFRNLMTRRFAQAIAQYRKFHYDVKRNVLGPEPRYFTYTNQRIGAQKTITDVDFVVSEGKEWAAPYQVPKTSGKYDPSVEGRYIHGHGDSEIDVKGIKNVARRGKLPERFHTADGKFAGVLIGKSPVKIGRWYMR